jgi:hypothetical protein
LQRSVKPVVQLKEKKYLCDVSGLHRRQHARARGGHRTLEPLAQSRPRSFGA